ncbi:Type 1 glutamine amidotransferase-like domain-containing protein [Enterococcus faecalis]
MKMGLVIDEVDVSNIASEEIKYKLRNNEFIYVTGGNSFFLLQELKKSGAAQVLIDEINQGKLYIGESAGAIVLTNSIVYIERMDQP